MSGVVYIIRGPNTPKLIVGSTTRPLEEVLEECLDNPLFKELFGSGSILPVELTEFETLKQKEKEWKKIFKSKLVASVSAGGPKPKKIRTVQLPTQDERSSFSNWFENTLVATSKKPQTQRPEVFKKFLQDFPKSSRDKSLLTGSSLKKSIFLQLLEEKCGGFVNRSGKWFLKGFSLPGPGEVQVSK